MHLNKTIRHHQKKIHQWAIVVAAGSGSRMQTGVLKQFLELCGKPILMHTIEAFANACEGISVVLVLPAMHVAFWQELCHRYRFAQPHQIAEGGDTRFQSVKNGLSLVSGEGLVAIHDGVRPLVSRQTIIKCFRDAGNYGNAVPVLPVVDSVREVSGQTSRMLDRSLLRLVQTPQVFDITLLKKAYGQEYSAAFTDDATVFEQAGHIIRLTEGNPENIKITTKSDLAVAEVLFKQSVYA